MILPLALSGVIASALTGGCNSDTTLDISDDARNIADLLCNAYFECECPTFDDPVKYASQEQCRSTKEAEIQMSIDEAEASGWTHDGECLARKIALVEDIGCKSLSHYNQLEINILTGEADCKDFYGDKPVGASCSSVFDINADECARDVTCMLGTCMPKRPSPNEPCAYSVDPLSNEICLGPAICMDRDDDGIGACETMSGLGEMCQADLCEPYLACAPGSSSCVAAPSEGEPCAPASTPWSQCANGLACDSGICRPLPDAGAPCLQLDGRPQCLLGLTCEAGTCVQARPIVCDDPIL